MMNVCELTRAMWRKKPFDRYTLVTLKLLNLI